MYGGLILVQSDPKFSKSSKSEKLFKQNYETCSGQLRSRAVQGGTLAASESLIDDVQTLIENQN